MTDITAKLAAEQQLTEFLNQFDLNEQERIVRYALDHVVPKLKGRTVRQHTEAQAGGTEGLLPCPFCGAHLPTFSKNIGGDNRHHTIACTECPGRAHFRSSTEAQAVEAWNRRAALAAAPAAAQGEPVMYTRAALDAHHEAGRQQGMSQANALWEMAKAEQAVPVSSKEAAEALLAAGHEFWLSVGRENYKAQGAVQWLTATDGTLVLFTRGEYKRTLLTNIEALPGSTAVHWGIPGDEDEDERGLLACSHDATPPATPPATERRPLSDADISRCYYAAFDGEIPSTHKFARAIEAAHNIGTAGTTEQAKEQKT